MTSSIASADCEFSLLPDASFPRDRLLRAQSNSDTLGESSFCLLFQALSWVPHFIYTVGKLLALLFKIRCHIDPLGFLLELQFLSPGKWLFSVSYIILDELTSSMQLLPPATSASLCQPEPSTFCMGVFVSSTVLPSTVSALVKHSLLTRYLC